jgi:clan AA aspartic protease
MSETRVLLKLFSPLGSIEVEALADTGATFTKIPKDAAAKLGLEVKYQTPIELADRRIITRRLALAEIEIEGVRRPALVAVAGNEETPLLGYTTLEALGFKVNPLTRKLEKAVATEY